VNNTKEQGDFLTTRETAALLGVSLRTIQLWVESGVLNAWKTVGGHRRIPHSAVTKLLDKQKQDMDEVADTKPFKILVVEDEPELLQVYQVHINSWGLNCEVLTAKDGYESLLQIGKYHPELIVSNLVMPDMDVFRMVRLLKDREETKRTQIIVVTIFNNDEIEEQGGLPSDVLVLHKPIPFEIIKEVVLDRVSSKQSR
jgi:excisionase family DNA binding protein